MIKPQQITNSLTFSNEIFNRKLFFFFCSVLRLKHVPGEILKLGQPQKVACF